MSLNLYTYCHNEPIMYTDPSGHWGKDVHDKKTTKWATEEFENYLTKDIVVYKKNSKGKKVVDDKATEKARDKYLDNNPELGKMIDQYVEALVSGDMYVDNEYQLMHVKYDNRLEMKYTKNKKLDDSKVTYQEYDEVFHGFAGHSKASNQFTKTMKANSITVLTMPNYDSSKKGIKNNIVNNIVTPVRNTLTLAINEMETDKTKRQQAQDVIKSYDMHTKAPTTYFGEQKGTNIEAQASASMFLLGMGLHTLQDETAHVTVVHEDKCDMTDWDYHNNKWEENGSHRIKQAEADTRTYISSFLNNYGSYLFSEK